MFEYRQKFIAGTLLEMEYKALLKISSNGSILPSEKLRLTEIEAIEEVAPLEYIRFLIREDQLVTYFEQQAFEAEMANFAEWPLDTVDWLGFVRDYQQDTIPVALDGIGYAVVMEA